MTALAVAAATRAPAHADPNPSLVPTGTTLVYLFQGPAGYTGKMTVEVTAKNAGTDTIDVTIVPNDPATGIPLSGSGTMKELPTLFALDVSLDAIEATIHFTGQIKRSTGEGSGKMKVEGTYSWFPWNTLGFYK
jgi:hypothetical protein